MLNVRQKKMKKIFETVKKMGKKQQKLSKKYKNCRKIPVKNNQNDYNIVNQHFTKLCLQCAENE